MSLGVWMTMRTTCEDALARPRVRPRPEYEYPRPLTEPLTDRRLVRRAGRLAYLAYAIGHSFPSIADFTHPLGAVIFTPARS